MRAPLSANQYEHSDNDANDNDDDANDDDDDLKYPVVMGMLRTRLSFCLLRWAITCFRGCRGSCNRRRVNSFVAQCRLAA